MNSLQEGFRINPSIASVAVDNSLFNNVTH